VCRGVDGDAVGTPEIKELASFRGMGIIDRVRGILGIARALRLRQNDTSHTMEQTIKTRALKATKATNAGMNLAIISSASEVLEERLNEMAAAAGESPV